VPFSRLEQGLVDTHSRVQSQRGGVPASGFPCLGRSILPSEESSRMPPRPERRRRAPRGYQLQRHLADREETDRPSHRRHPAGPPPPRRAAASSDQRPRRAGGRLPVPRNGGFSASVTRHGYSGLPVAGRPPPAILRAEVCASCARNRFADSCLGHGDLCAQVRPVFLAGGGVERPRLAGHRKTCARKPDARRGVAGGDLRPPGTSVFDGSRRQVVSSSTMRILQNRICLSTACHLEPRVPIY